MKSDFARACEEAADIETELSGLPEEDPLSYWFVEEMS